MDRGSGQVAEKFDYTYGATRRLLGKHITLRNRGGTYAASTLRTGHRPKSTALYRWRMPRSHQSRRCFRFRTVCCT